jgi:hypothetical protein
MQRDQIGWLPRALFKGSFPLTQFLNLSSQVVVEHDEKSFNLAEFDHGQTRIQYDQQMMAAKLKRL